MLGVVKDFCPNEECSVSEVEHARKKAIHGGAIYVFRCPNCGERWEEER